jgi:hypothetical protein
LSVAKPQVGKFKATVKFTIAHLKVARFGGVVKFTNTPKNPDFARDV